MTLPGFAAEAAIYRLDQQYRGARVAAISGASGVTASLMLPGNTPCANQCNPHSFLGVDPCTCALSYCGNFNNMFDCCADFFNNCQPGFEGPGSMGGGEWRDTARRSPRPGPLLIAG